MLEIMLLKFLKLVNGYLKSKNSKKEIKQFIESLRVVGDELNQIGIKIDMYRQEYRFTPAFAFIQAV